MSNPRSVGVQAYIYLLDGPGGGFTDDGFRIEEDLLKSRKGGSVALIAEDDAGVAEEAPAARSPQGRVLKAFAEFFFGEAQKFDQIGRVEIRPWLEGEFARWRRLSVPGADLLADVAAEEPVADARPPLIGNGASQLDGQITDAAARVEDAGGGEGIGGTGVEAGSASAAVAGLEGRIRSQLDVQQQAGEEEVTAEVLVQEHGVLAEPAEASSPGKVALQKWGRVNDATPVGARHLFLYPGQQLI